jgi:hypothetical protein
MIVKDKVFRAQWDERVVVHGCLPRGGRLLLLPLLFGRLLLLPLPLLLLIPLTRLLHLLLLIRCE